MSPHDAATKLASKVGSGATIREFRGESTVLLGASDLVTGMLYCRDELGFDLLLDICSVDNSGEDPRFEVVYELCSIADGTHLRIKTVCAEDAPEIPTVSHIWPTANWHEREVFDMMGIRFSDHPDLRRILMWEGYPYHPLRKEFPLAGRESAVEEVAFTAPAPLAGGPFVTAPGSGATDTREPRSRA
jgi:NADH-quinone oxidoreductase subunit C